MTKRTLKYIFIALVIVILALAIWYFFFRNTVADPNKTNTAVPPGSPTPKWIPESFPLNIGMYGTHIKTLQTALGISADGKFGPITSAAITSGGYSVPLTVSDYNKIVPASAAVSISQNQNLIKGAYAKCSPTTIRNKDLSQYETQPVGNWLGTITGEDSQGTYWELDQTYYVIKTCVDIHA